MTQWANAGEQRTIVAEAKAVYAAISAVSRLTAYVERVLRATEGCVA